jgi:V8-like Glu-specific endopeptidase
MKIISTLMLYFISLSIQARVDLPLVPKVIYGADDRIDLYQTSDNLLKQFSLSIAAQIPNEKLIKKGDQFILEPTSLNQSGVCKSERFANQPIAADCSGFLVAPDLLVTAGHCFKTLSDCKENYWVFDYANFSQEKSQFSFKSNQLYRCTNLVAHTFGMVDKNDYSVVKLDRVVEGRIPLNIRKSGKVENDASLVVIGYPSGLPLKIIPSFDIRDNSNNIFFTVNSDTYSGSSGAAVINTKTSLVEGILVRGDLDYIQSLNDSCRISNRKENSSGRGEDIIRITTIPELMH